MQQRSGTAFFTPKQPVISLEDRESALKEIAKKSYKELLSTIILITNEGMQLTADKPHLQNAFIFLQYAKNFFQEARQNANLSLFQNIKFIKELSKEIIISKFETLVNNAQSISVTEESLRLFSELALWLEGLYRLTYDDPMIKKDESGKVIQNQNGGHICIDHEDRLLQISTGISKLQIAEYYVKAAETIRGKVEEYNMRQVIAPASPHK